MAKLNTEIPYQIFFIKKSASTEMGSGGHMAPTFYSRCREDITNFCNHIWMHTSYNPNAVQTFNTDTTMSQMIISLMRQSTCLSNIMSIINNTIKGVKDHRIILAPHDSIKNVQSSICEQLNIFQPHQCSFGFARDRSTLDCVNFHINSHTSKIELLINLDIKNFFTSLTEKDMTDALIGHGFSPEETLKIIEKCTIKLTQSNLIQLIAKSCLNNTNLKAAYKYFKEEAPNPSYRANRITFADFEKTSRKCFCKVLNTYLYRNVFTVNFLENWCAQILNLGTHQVRNCRFLPQGSPASPVLSNITFKRMDFRLQGFAAAHGAIYTRYADDISFTWSKRMGKKPINLFIHTVKEILRNMQLEVHPKKTKVIGSGGQMNILGYIINSGKPTIPKRYFEDTRKQILGISDSVSKGHISSKIKFDKISQVVVGKINFIKTASPEKAEKLSKMFAAISPPGVTSRREIHLA